MTKPDPMAEDELDKLFDEYFPVGTVTSNDRKDDDKALLMTDLLRYRRDKFKAAINAYTTNKIIEELERLRVEASKNCDAYNANYFKELSAELVKRIAELRKIL